MLILHLLDLFKNVQVLTAQGFYQYSFNLSEIFFSNVTCVKFAATLASGKHYMMSLRPFLKAAGSCWLLLFHHIVLMARMHPAKSVTPTFLHCFLGDPSSVLDFKGYEQSCSGTTSRKSFQLYLLCDPMP